MKYGIAHLQRDLLLLPVGTTVEIFAPTISPKASKSRRRRRLAVPERREWIITLETPMRYGISNILTRQKDGRGLRSALVRGIETHIGKVVRASNPPGDDS